MIEKPCIALETGIWSDEKRSRWRPSARVRFLAERTRSLRARGMKVRREGLARKARQACRIEIVVRVEIVYGGGGEKKRAARGWFRPFSTLASVHRKSSLASARKEKSNENRPAFTKAESVTYERKNGNTIRMDGREITRGRERETRGETIEVSFSVRSVCLFNERKQGKRNAPAENQRVQLKLTAR